MKHSWDWAGCFLEKNILFQVLMSELRKKNICFVQMTCAEAYGLMEVPIYILWSSYIHPLEFL